MLQLLAQKGCCVQHVSSHLQAVAVAVHFLLAELCRPSYACHPWAHLNVGLNVHDYAEMFLGASFAHTCVTCHEVWKGHRLSLSQNENGMGHVGGAALAGISPDHGLV